MLASRQPRRTSLAKEATTHPLSGLGGSHDQKPSKAPVDVLAIVVTASVAVERPYLHGRASLPVCKALILRRILSFIPYY